MNSKHVANNLCDIRKQKHITQHDLAEHVGVSRQTIISIEKGNYTPSVLLALKIAQTLDTPIDNLFFINEK